MVCWSIVLVLVLVRLFFWGLETWSVPSLLCEDFRSCWRLLSESDNGWDKVVLHLRDLVSCLWVLSLWRSGSGSLKSWGQLLHWGRVWLWLCSADWGLGSACGKVSPVDTTFRVIWAWIPVLLCGWLYWLLCSFNKGLVCERLFFSGTLLSLEQVSGVLFWGTLWDPEERLNSGLSKESSALLGASALLVSSVLRMVHRVLVSRPGAGTVIGLWENELDSDLNLKHTH